jgi:hypothetical protein
VVGDPLDHARAEVARLVDDVDSRGLIAAADLPTTSVRAVADAARPARGPVAVRIDVWDSVEDLERSAAGRPTAHEWPSSPERTVTLVGATLSVLSATAMLIAPGSLTLALPVGLVAITAFAALRWRMSTVRAVRRWTALTQRPPIAQIPITALAAPTDAIERATAAFLRCRDAATRVAPPLAGRLHVIVDRLASVVGAMVRLSDVEREHAAFLVRLAAAGLDDPDVSSRRPVSAVLSDAAAHLERHVESFERIVQLDAIGRDPRRGAPATVESRIAALVRGIDTELAETGFALHAQIEARRELDR